MVVGVRKLVVKDILNNAKTADTLRLYAKSLIPDFAKHIPNIVDNQIFLVASALRLTNIPHKEKMALCEELLQGINVKGQLNTIYSVEDILMRINIEKFRRLLDGGGNRGHTGSNNK